MDKIKYSIYFRITDNCNLICRHCCYSCASGKSSMSYETAKKIINNLPENIKQFGLTGGEITLENSLTNKILKYVSKKDMCCDMAYQTNGHWIKNEKILLDKINELKKLYFLLGCFKQ